MSPKYYNYSFGYLAKESLFTFNGTYTMKINRILEGITIKTFYLMNKHILFVNI